MPEDKKAKKEYTSIRIDPELWKEAKIQAIKEDLEVSTLVEQALKDRLKVKGMK